MSISVIAPVFNEQELLKASLDSIANQTLVPQEVLVGIDAKTTDRSGDVAEAHPIVSRVIYGAMDTYSVQRLLLSEAQGDVVVNVDGDSFISSNWIERAVEHLMNPEVSLVTGFIKPREENLINNFICNFQNSSPLYLSGCTSAFRKADLNRLTLDSFLEIPLWKFKVIGTVVKDPTIYAVTRIPTREQLKVIRETGFVGWTLLSLFLRH